MSPSRPGVHISDSNLNLSMVCLYYLQQGAEKLANEHHQFANCLNNYGILASSERADVVSYNVDMICTLGGYHRYCDPRTHQLIRHPYGSSCAGEVKFEFQCL